jgi:acetolactate synthase I/II/III large subunit
MKLAATVQRTRALSGHSAMPETEAAGIRGAEILIRGLVANGVDSIFGLPGGAVLHIYDELWRYREAITHYLVRHEQGAVHAAEGFARATGRVGVALVTSGPGATNAVTGIATAYMDSIPLVVITGQVPTSLIGTDAFQEVDTFGITLPIVKHSFLVRQAADLEDIVNEAFHLASTGRPGPVVIDIPKDVTAEKSSYVGRRANYSASALNLTADAGGALDLAVERILRAKRPVFYVGGGIVSGRASDELVSVVEALGVPVTPTLMGLGGFPSAHPQCLGMLGMHGTYASNMAVAESDLLVAIGVRFDDRVTGKLAEFSPNSDVIHIDIDASNIGKIRKAQIAVVSDARTALKAVSEKLESAAVRSDRLSGWWQSIRSWQASVPLEFESSDTEIRPQMVIKTLHAITGGDADQRRARNNGFRPAGGDRGWNRVAGGPGHRGSRRRRFPDDQSGDNHRDPIQCAPQGADNEQRLFGYGPAMAGDVL